MKRCNLCGSANIEFVYEGRDNYERYEIWWCNGCRQHLVVRYQLPHDGEPSQF